MRRWWLLIGGVLIVAGLGWWLVRVAYLDSAERGNASGYGQFVLAVVGLLIIVGGWIFKAFSPAEGLDVDHLTDALALAMRGQWETAAIDRLLVQPAPLPIRWCWSGQPFSGSTSAALAAPDGCAPFDPLPGLSQTTVGLLHRGTRRTLHSVYGGLPSGRLLIVGGPGSGKSSAAILLLLDALRYREQAAAEDRPHIPVPVIFTLHGWDPRATPVTDWLVTKLTNISVFAGGSGAQRARDLLHAGRVAVFLDGLDEIPPAIRPLALRALSQQATFRLVVLTRSTELIAATRKETLAGAAVLELQPLAPTDVADYLLRPLTQPAPPSWYRVTTVLTQHPDSNLARALTTPLAVGLLRDIYPPTATVDELLDTTRFPHSTDIINHLLDSTITAAYTPRLGQPLPPYTPETAHRTLTLIAHRLNLDHTRDFAWWTVPNWTPAIPRALLSAVLAATLFSLTRGPMTGLIVGLAVGLMHRWTIWWFGLPVVEPSPVRISRSGLHRPDFSRLASGIGLGLAFGIAGGLALGLLFGLMLGLQEPGVDDSSSAGPGNVLRRDRIFGIAAGLVTAMLVGTITGLIYGPITGLILGPLFGLGFGLLSSIAWVTALVHIYLSRKHRIPRRLFHFLEDARARHLLRTVGPVYQFRHATLQDRLAATYRQENQLPEVTNSYSAATPQPIRARHLATSTKPRHWPAVHISAVLIAFGITTIIKAFHVSNVVDLPSDAAQQCARVGMGQLSASTGHTDSTPTWAWVPPGLYTTSSIQQSKNIFTLTGYLYEFYPYSCQIRHEPDGTWHINYYLLQHSK